MNKTVSLLIPAVMLMPLSLGAISPKRGVCWDEKTTSLNQHHAELLKSGVSWAYNWGPDAAVSDAYSEEFAFLPMAWNGAYNASRIRAWLTSHPESRYLLAFNEPNFADQACMTPQQAADAWADVESISDEFGLRLVAPALNFSSSQVGGRVWNPYEWYDEFFRLVPDAHIDCLAMHCYMNWASPTSWLATEYFYSDLYNASKDCYGKYPHLVAFLDRYKSENGHFPHMMLTEFCAWENDGTITGVAFQIDQMTQKVQMLEQSDLVEGYAWFMANATGGPSAYPYMSVLTDDHADAGLSELGLVYVNMSDFSAENTAHPGETFAAKDYVDATLGDNALRLRANSETGSELPIQVEIPAGGYPTYNIEVPYDGDYTFSFHVSSAAATTLALYVDVAKKTQTQVNTGSAWSDVTMTVNLTAGSHTIMPYNSGTKPVLLNSFGFTANNPDGIADIAAKSAGIRCVYDLSGRTFVSDNLGSLSSGIYVVRDAAGKTNKIKINNL